VYAYVRVCVPVFVCTCMCVCVCVCMCACKHGTREYDFFTKFPLITVFKREVNIGIITIQQYSSSYVTRSKGQIPNLSFPLLKMTSKVLLMKRHSLSITQLANTNDLRSITSYRDFLVSFSTLSFFIRFFCVFSYL